MAKNDANGPAWEEIDPVIPPSDELEALIKPPHLGEVHKGKECDAAGEEQRRLFRGKGEQEARPHDNRAAELDRPRKTAEKQVEVSERAYEQTSDFMATAIIKLRPYVNRPAHAKLLYWLRFVCLLFGDVAGISGASLLLGETYVNAFGQAISAGVAAITLGAIGSEVKRLVQARARASVWEELPDDYLPFKNLFIGRTDADRLIRLVTVFALLGITVIAVAIFTLRGATEGGAAAWCFGLIAAAIGMGSFINSYTTTCDVSEFIDVLKADAKQSDATLTKHRDDPVIQQHDAALATAKNIRDTNAALGEAAWWGRQREKYAIFSANPRVVGHGEAVVPSVGRVEAVPTPDEGLNTTGEQDAA